VRRGLVASVIAVAAITFTATPAWAPPPGTAPPTTAPTTPTSPPRTGGAGALPDGPGVYAAYRETIEMVDAPDRIISRPATHWCAYWPALAGGDGGNYEDFLHDLSNIVPRRGDPQSGFVVRQCFERGAVDPYVRAVLPWVPPVGRPAVPVLPPDVNTIETVEAFAMARLALVAPSLTTSPPAGRLLTGLETWIGVAPPAPVAVTAQVGEFWATATATAATVTLDLGDGTTLTCPLTDTAPPADVRPECLRHTYLDSRLGDAGRFTLRATLAYTVTIVTYLDENPTPVDPATGPPVVVAVAVRPAQAVRS
jgi:hypothetical protein